MHSDNSALIIAVSNGAHLPWWSVVIIIGGVCLVVCCVSAILYFYLRE